MKRRGFLKGLVSLVVAAPAVGVGASGVVSQAVQGPVRKADSAISGGFGCAIIHKQCGGVHSYYAHRPKIGEDAHAHLSRKVDGSVPDNGEPMFCGSCGKHSLYIDLVPMGGWAEGAS